jgi:hypothetical protein
MVPLGALTITTAIRSGDYYEHKAIFANVSNVQGAALYVLQLMNSVPGVIVEQTPFDHPLVHHYTLKVSYTLNPTQHQGLLAMIYQVLAQNHLIDNETSMLTRLPDPLVSY